MSNLFSVYLRELRSYVTTPIAWFVGVIFLLVTGVLFLLTLLDYSRYSFEILRSGYAFRVEGLTVAEGILRPMLSSVSFIALFMIPLITMRSFSEEKKTGTIEMLFTYPLRDAEIVMGKFLAVVTVFLVLVAGAFFHEFEMGWFKPIPWRESLSGFLGLVLLGGLFSSIGVFVSTLTENQIIAGTWTFGLNLLLWLAGWLTDDPRSPLSAALKYLSAFEHFDSFAVGIIDTRDVFYFVTLTGLFLFFTLRVLETRRWRS